ncbi:MAG: DUF4321 domain-containing protein [Lachnospiraceae bacterium]|nr:DUF4321 domain-containing protein [Lachnospiraceae bacterium]
MARDAGKKTWALLLLILAGIVIGGFLGYLARDVSWLSWLNYGQEFGLGSGESGYLTLNLGMIVIHFGLSIKITIASIIGVIISIFVYRRL